MTVKEAEGKIILEPQTEDIVDALFGKLAGKSSLTRALLEDRAEEKQHALYSTRNSLRSSLLRPVFKQ